MWYVRCYKTFYLALIVSNFFLLLPPGKGVLEVFLLEKASENFFRYINLFTILINVVSFILLEIGASFAVSIEKVLSWIRMLVLVLIASVILSVVLVFIIPTGFFWYKIIFSSAGYYAYLPVPILFVLELVYYIKLSSYRGSTFKEELRKYRHFFSKERW